MEKKENNQFLYDAFISYRHTDLDMFVAENLHKQMEAFKPPKSVLKKEGGRKKISRVFRDRDELPLASNLEDPILDALRQSEYLIVICSPRLKESMWCKKEIQTFIEMHGRRKILAVLVEGEPADSFPEELLYTEEYEHLENGRYELVKKPIEPLAADFRGADKSAVKKAMKSEILRLLAPMFDVSYDDLRQRHREQRIRKVLGAASVVAALGVAFGAYSTYTAIKIDNQKKQIEQQAELLAKEQAGFLADDALSLFHQDNRPDSIQMAYNALTEYQGVSLPKTAKAERVLAECLGVYDGASVAIALDHVETNGIISKMQVSPEGTYVLSADTLGQLVLWDMESRENIYEMNDSYEVREFGFIDEQSFYYLSADEGLVKVFIPSREKTIYEKDEDALFDFYNGAAISPDGKILVLQRMSNVDFVDTKSFQKIATYEGKNGMFENELAVSGTTAYMIEKQDDDVFVVGIDMKNGKELFSTKMPDCDIYDSYCSDDSVYFVGFSAENLFSGISTVSAIDAKSGEIRFATELDMLLATKIYYAKGDASEKLLVAGGSQAAMLDAKSGDYNMIYHIESDIAKCAQANDGRFMLYTADGLIHLIDVTDNYSDIAIQSLVCQDVIQFEKTIAGLAGIKKNDNRVVFYSYLNNVDAKVYEDEVAEPKIEGVLGDEAKVFAKENEIARPTFVYSYMDMADADLTLVSYVDNTFALYRTSTMELLQTCDDCQKGAMTYYGKMNEYYLAEVSYTGYLFDKNGELHGVIPEMKGVSKDGEKVVVFGRDVAHTNENADIAIPVYNVDELIEKAEEYLE